MTYLDAIETSPEDEYGAGRDVDNKERYVRENGDVADSLEGNDNTGHRRLRVRHPTGYSSCRVCGYLRK
jgi:hypothetical protein